MFYIIQLLFLKGRGPDKWTPACDSPNPPPWCDEQVEPGAPIDQYILYFLIIAVIIGMYLIWKDKK
jgi:hypothetical protein